MSTPTGDSPRQDRDRADLTDRGRTASDRVTDRDRDRTDLTDRDRNDRQVGDHGVDRDYPQDRRSVLEREKDAFGGIKFGSAFFGWLTAVGTTVLLAGLVAAAGTAVGFSLDTSVEEAAGQASDNATELGIGSAIALLVILFIAYYCGGYVAGRMARFNGSKQGFAVWLWAVLVAVVVTVLGLVAGDRFDVLAQLDSLPQIPVSADDATTTGLIALAAVAAVTLLGAVLGGLAGMRFHRKVDEVGHPTR